MSSPCHCNNLRLATRKLSAAYDAALAPLGINIAQYALLRMIQTRQPVSITALGLAQGLERSTVGRNIRVLERQGLVATGRSDEDQRETVIRLTGPGEALLEKALPAWEACQLAFETRIGADRVRALGDILAVI